MLKRERIKECTYTAHDNSDARARPRTFKGVVYITRCPRAKVAAAAASRAQYGRRKQSNGQGGFPGWMLCYSGARGGKMAIKSPTDLQWPSSQHRWGRRPRRSCPQQASQGPDECMTKDQTKQEKSGRNDAKTLNSDEFSISEKLLNWILPFSGRYRVRMERS